MCICSAEDAWDAQSIACIAVGGGTIIIAGVYECYTKRRPIVAPRLFKTRTTTIVLCVVFFHSMAFFIGSYMIPYYFQVRAPDLSLRAQIISTVVLRSWALQQSWLAFARCPSLSAVP